MKAHRVNTKYTFFYKKKTLFFCYAFYNFCKIKCLYDLKRKIELIPKTKFELFFWFFPKSEGKKISIDNIHLFVNKCFEESGKDGDQLNTNKSTWINASKCKLWGEMASEELPPLPHLSTSTFFKAFNESRRLYLQGYPPRMRLQRQPKTLKMWLSKG